MLAVPVTKLVDHPCIKHRSLVVARGYIRRGTLFVDNPAAQVGL